MAIRSRNPSSSRCRSIINSSLVWCGRSIGLEVGYIVQDKRSVAVNLWRTTSSSTSSGKVASACCPSTICLCWLIFYCVSSVGANEVVRSLRTTIVIGLVIIGMVVRWYWCRSLGLTIAAWNQCFMSNQLAKFLLWLSPMIGVNLPSYCSISAWSSSASVGISTMICILSVPSTMMLLSIYF